LRAKGSAYIAISLYIKQTRHTHNYYYWARLS